MVAKTSQETVMNFPVCMSITVKSDPDGSHYFIFMRGTLLAEPRKGGILQLDAPTSPSGVIVLKIKSAIEDLTWRWISVKLETIEDPTTITSDEDPEKAIKALEEILSKLGWFAVGPDGTAKTVNEW